MAAITHLKDLYTSQGVSFIQDLFSKNVYITEKIDGARFAFEKTKDNELVYYKRNATKPINMVDRTVMSYYEPAIEYIESLNLSSIPSGPMFGFEYFTTTNPGSISYDKVPKNGLMLTDISKGGSLITNIDELVKYANILKVSPPPIIHNGKLNTKQKEQLEEFLSADWEELISKFKTQSFTSYIISILNPKLKNTALNVGITKPIEGIVFSFDDGKSFINTKVVDPLYTQKARERSKDRFTDVAKENNVQLTERLRDIIKFIKQNKDSIDTKPTSNNKELRYIEVLSDIFYSYYEKNKSKFKNIVADKPDMDSLDVNYRHLTNKKLISVLKSKEDVKLVFKKFLASFVSTRNRGNQILKKDMVSDINSLVPKLKKLSEGKSYDSLMETTLQKIVNILTGI
jgi:hypothetical protein